MWPGLLTIMYLVPLAFPKIWFYVQSSTSELYPSLFRVVFNSASNNKKLCSLTDAYEPLSRIIPISKNKLTPYRAVIIMRLIVLGLFFHYRITNPVNSAFGLWMTSVICEIWFGFSWILDQFPKWYPINRETYVDRLTARYVC